MDSSGITTIRIDPNCINSEVFGAFNISDIQWEERNKGRAIRRPVDRLTTIANIRSCFASEYLPAALASIVVLTIDSLKLNSLKVERRPPTEKTKEPIRIGLVSANTR